MTREEYQDKERKLMQVKADLISEYIKTNSPYPIGTKLRINFKDPDESVIGIVKRYEISGWDEVHPVLAKVKNDGNAHKTAEEFISWRRVKSIEVVE